MQTYRRTDTDIQRDAQTDRPTVMHTEKPTVHTESI